MHAKKFSHGALTRGASSAAAAFAMSHASLFAANQLRLIRAFWVESGFERAVRKPAVEKIFCPGKSGAGRRILTV
jgi:hypothetical protein